MQVKKLVGPAALALAASAFIAGQSRTIKDDLGREWTIGPPPRRIVSLAPNVTEILFALGLEERIVGVTRYCDYPAGALNKDKVGGLVDPGLEKISALKPDLILAFRGNPVRALGKMRSLGLPVFSLEPGTSLESLSRRSERSASSREARKPPAPSARRSTPESRLSKPPCAVSPRSPRSS